MKCGNTNRFVVASVIVLVVAVCLSSCQSVDRNPPPEVKGGDPAAGAGDIARLGCGGCHVIPGISGADGTVGPPLNDFGHRGFIAGELFNKPSNLMHWLEDPQGVEPGTDMPDLGVSPVQARDIAAYLYTLD
jgi:cytochrome c